MSESYVVNLDSVGLEDVAEVGGKNASSGEMLRALSGMGIRVPGGFATTAAAYRRFLDSAQLVQPVQAAIDAYHRGETLLAETGSAIRGLILETDLPSELSNGVLEAYRLLGEQGGSADPAVAVRSSATAEDLPGASFAGQQETFLNVRGERALLDACRRCYASLFTDRAISYRDAKGFGHLDVALSIGVQRMVRSDKAGSG